MRQAPQLQTPNPKPLENLYTPRCIRTVSGVYVNIFEPTPDMFRIEDIAHALSHQCRFGAHLPVFYSVAQHSINCCRHAEEKDKFSALMHDASEAYLIDIPSPVKAELTNYKEIEHRLMTVLAEKFKFEYPLSPAVLAVDKDRLEWEWENIMIKRGIQLPIYTYQQAKHTFLSYYNSYKP